MNIVEELKNNKNLSDEQFKLLLETDTYKDELFKQADIVRQQVYGKDVYLRGLIEFSNYCKNGCYYYRKGRLQKDSWQEYKRVLRQANNRIFNSGSAG